MIRMLLASLFVMSSYAVSETEIPTVSDRSEPLVQLDIVVDTKGIEQAILMTNESMGQVIDALDKIANNKNLTPQQAEAISITTDNINQLALSSTQVVDVLPEAISNAQAKVLESSQQFLSDLKMDILIILVIVALVLVIALACLYWLVIKPMQHTIMSATSNVASMASSIQVTTKSLEESSKNHAKLIQILDKNEINTH